MDRVKSQAAVVSQLLFDPKTADAYKNVLVLTGQIIKEVALLLWLVICSVLVFIAWFSNIATSSGSKARAWWEAQQTDSADGNQAAAATGQALLDVSQNGAYFLINKAREQLGLHTIERPAKVETPAAKAPATKSAPPAKATTEKTAEKVTAAAKETQTSVNKASQEAKE